MDDLDLNSWMLPPSVLECYHQSGFTHMYEWQKECLQLPGVLDGKNLVYSAPTGSGKTFIVEMIIARNILNKGGRAVLLFPFISVAREKLFWLQQLFQGTGVIVDGFMGGLSPPGGITSVDIAICTIEKGNSLINRMIQDNTIDQIRILAVDELHFITDECRGFMLEILLTKLRYMSQHTSEHFKVQIIGFSATVSNLQLLSKWLDAVMYETTFRALPLTKYIVVGKDVFDVNLTKTKEIEPVPNCKLKDIEISSLCYEAAVHGHSVLVFCPTKQWCEGLACTVSQNLINGISSHKNCDKTSLINAREDILCSLKQTPAGLDNVLFKTIPGGVAFHHAGLTMEERDLIEKAFKQGVINVIFATSTLSSGVNLPAKRVIIRTPFFHGKLLSVQLFHQMAGRAGRKEYDKTGECFILCEKHEMKICAQLLTLPFPEIKSSLFLQDVIEEDIPDRLKKAVLEVIGNEIALNDADIECFYRSTLYGLQIESCSGTKFTVTDILGWLRSNEFISGIENNGERSVFCSKLGKASLFSSLSVAQALHVFRDLSAAAKSFALDTELHLLYLITPLPGEMEWKRMNWFNYSHILETLGQAEQRVCHLIGIKESFLMRMASNSSKKANPTKKHDRILTIHMRFYVTLMLHELVNESSLLYICNKYGCNKGYVQSLQQSASAYAGMITTFCKELGWWSFEMLLGEFQLRLFFGVERDLLDLVKIPCLNNRLARLFFNAGFTTCERLSIADHIEVEQVLTKSSKFLSLKKDCKDTEWDVEERRKQTLVKLHDHSHPVTHATAACHIIKAAKSILGQKDTNVEPNPDKFKQLSVNESRQLDSKYKVQSNGSDALETSFDMFETLNLSTKFDSNVSQFQDFFCSWSQQKYFSVCFLQKQGSHDNIPSTIRGMAVCWSVDQVHFLNFEGDDGTQMYKSAISVFHRLTEDSTIVVKNAKNCYKYIRETLEVHPKSMWEDPTIASWVLDSECPPAVNTFSLSSSSLRKLQHYHAKNVTGKCTALCCNTCEEAFSTFLSMVHLKQQLIERKIYNYFLKIEMQHVLIIAHLEINGIFIDLDVLRFYKSRLSEAMINLQSYAWTVVGHKFNLYNPAEVSKVFFGELNLDSKKDVVVHEMCSSKPKSANKMVLQSLCRQQNPHPLPQIVMDWRSVSHSLHKVIYPLCSNYLMDCEDITLHHPTCYLKTSTGRISMAEPSLQNIAKSYDICLSNKNEQERNMCVSLREMFIATTGTLLVAADYAQLELRLMAHLSDDSNLQQLFNDPKKDAFCEIACNLFNLESPQMVTAAQRKQTKQVCYGILYGMGPKTLSEQLSCPESEAKRLIENFWLQYPQVKVYMNRVIKKCKQTGYVQTLCGRRRSICHINSGDHNLRSHSERQAINTTVQGSAADLLKSATVKIQEQMLRRQWNVIRKQKLKNTDSCYIVHTLHDELIYEVDTKLIKEVTTLIKNCMEHALLLSTKLYVKVSIGSSWENLTSVEGSLYNKSTHL